MSIVPISLAATNNSNIGERRMNAYVQQTFERASEEPNRDRCIPSHRPKPQTFKKRSYFPPTTPAQRRLLFKTWQKTGSIQEACIKADVSRSTFYYWRGRFLKDGFEALERPYSTAPHRPHCLAEGIVQKVIEIRRQHANWGKLRIAKAVNRQLGPKSVSPSSVMRILRRANLW